jgi:hypothetical protein
MFEAAAIREWRGHGVVDQDGHKIGELKAVYVDTGTDLHHSPRLRSACQAGTGSCSLP